VAPNVAETSLTIPGIKYVVDSGRTKEKSFDKKLQISNLALVGFRGLRESNVPEELLAQDLVIAKDFTVALYVQKWTNSVSQKFLNFS
jgi:hypothetical protein